MSKEEWTLPRGWTCPHQHAKSLGPCDQCRPGNGLCLNCKRPLDDHDKVGTPTMSCRVQRQAA